VALSWGFPYHNCIFHGIVSQPSPCKAVEVKSQLLQLRSMNSQDDFTGLGTIHTSFSMSCTANGAAALVPSPAPGLSATFRVPAASLRCPNRSHAGCSWSSSHQTMGDGLQRGDCRGFTLSDPATKSILCLK